MMMLLVVILSALIGLSLGLLGGGGSILTIPMLLFTTKMAAQEAIATSLCVVASTSLVALIAHARAGRVHWRTGFYLGGASMLAAFGAGQLASFVPAPLLIMLLAVVMIMMAVAMLRPPRITLTQENSLDPSAPVPSIPLKKAILFGTILGTVTGLVGAGGGFLIVPILVLLGGLPMHNAAATSLLVIAMNTTAAFLGQITHIRLDWGLVSVISAASVSGSVIGSLYAHRVPQKVLRTAFAWLVLFTAGAMIYQQAPELVHMFSLGK